MNFCGLVANLQVVLKSAGLIEYTRKHTPGKVIASVNAFIDCANNIITYPYCYSPVRLYATALSGFVTP